MGNEHNPLIPAGYDIAWSVVTVLLIALTVIALITLARSAARMSRTHALVWTLIVLIVPVVGPIAWLTIGRQTVPAHRQT